MLFLDCPSCGHKIPYRGHMCFNCWADIGWKGPIDWNINASQNSAIRDAFEFIISMMMICDSMDSDSKAEAMDDLIEEMGDRGFLPKSPEQRKRIYEMRRGHTYWMEPING